MKKILLVMTFLLFLIGCETVVSKISIEVDDSTIPEFIYIGDEYDISNIKVKVNYSNDESETISLNDNMLNADDLAKFSVVGKHEIRVIDKDLSDTFTITVKEKEKDPVVISLTITGETVVYELSQITLAVSVTPAGSSSEVIWTSLNPDIAIVDQKGVVSALKPGFADIKVQLKNDPSVEKTQRIEVRKLNIALPNFNNYEIIIMVNEQLLGEHDPFSDKYYYIDKEYKKAAWEEIQNFYNVRLTVKPLPIDTPPFGPQRVNWLIQKAEANESLADIMVNHTDWLPQLGMNEAIVDVSSYYETYGRNSMAKGIKDSGTYKDGLYILPDNNIGKVIVDDGLFYNVSLLESLGLDNPAKLFNDGLWTYSKFEEYVKNAASKLNDNQSVLSGKPAYLYMGMANAAGVKLVDTVELTVNFEDTNVVEAVGILQDLYKIPKVWGSNAYDSENQSFNSGKSLFQVAEYDYLKNAARFHENMWGQDTRYGYVPFPYPDSMTKEQTKIIYKGGLVYQMVKGRTYTDGIKESDIFEIFTRMMNLTNDRFNDENQTDDYKAAIYREKLDDPESRKAISYFTDEHLIFEGFALVAPLWIYGGPMIDEVVVEGKDYLEVLEDYNTEKGVIVTKLKEIYG